MRKLLTQLLKALPLLLVMLAVTQVFAQRPFSPMAPVGPSDYNITLRNDVQTSDRTYEFDVYMQDLDATEPFEIATVQFGILVNPAIFVGGTVTIQIVAGSTTDMVVAQRYTAVPLWIASSGIIKLVPKTPPGCGGGTFLSQTAPGTRFARVRITNTVPFVANTSANLLFSFLTVPYPTKMFRYQNADEASPCTNTAMAMDVTNCYSLLANLPLNPTATCDNPLPYNVTGGGSFCEGGTSTFNVVLSNSETGVSYQLFDGTTPVGAPYIGVAGVGHDFGVQPVGSYTVKGTRTCPDMSTKTTTMNGTAVITMNLLPAAPSFTKVDPTCASALGSITITAPLGLTYSIGGAYQPELLFANLAAGDYTLYAKSVAGCISLGAPATILPQPLPPAQVTVSATQPTCASGVGSITVNTPAGLTYSVGGAYQADPFFGNLVAGDYNVTAKSVAGCISDPLVVTINAQPGTPVAPSLSSTDPACFETFGTITVTAPPAGYTYSLDGGAFGGPSFVGVSVGLHSVVAKNVAECTSPSASVTINPAPSPVAASFTQMGPYDQGTVGAMMPLVSDNGVTGTWVPAQVNTAVLGGSLYTFTPAVGACATGTTMTIVINAVVLPCLNSTWNGSVSTDWFNAANWDFCVPTFETNVTIPGGKLFYPTLTTPGTAIASILIQDGGSFIGAENLVIAPLAALVERNIVDTHAHLVSSPVVSTTWANVYAAGDPTKIWVRAWNPVSGAWVNETAAGSPVVGKGYAESNTLTAFPLVSVFQGTLNHANVACPALSTANGAWNLLGNPFQSALDWPVVLAANPGIVGNAVWVWNAAGGNYINYADGVGGLLNGIVPAQNGFFVSALANGPSLNIPLTARVHGHAGLYKEAIANVLELQADGNGGSDQMFVRFTNDASAAYDNQFDARKRTGEAYAPQLYSMITNDVLSINALPLPGNEVVNLGFSCNTNGEYSFTATGMESFDASTPILLEDMKVNTTQDLRANAVYNFSYAAGENANRFKLHFKSTTGINGVSNNGIYVYSNDRNVVINNTTSLAGEVWVYDMTGRELNHSNITSQMKTSIPMQVAEGAYMVKVVIAKASVNQKVFIR